MGGRSQVGEVEERLRVLGEERGRDAGVREVWSRWSVTGEELHHRELGRVEDLCIELHRSEGRQRSELR